MRMGGLGAALVGSEEPGHRVEPGVCPGLTCPQEVDKGKARGRVRVDRLTPRGVLENKGQTASPGGGHQHVAAVCGPSRPNPPRQAPPASLARGRLTFN